MSLEVLRETIRKTVARLDKGEKRTLMSRLPKRENSAIPVRRSLTAISVRLASDPCAKLHMGLAVFVASKPILLVSGRIIAVWERGGGKPMVRRASHSPG